MLQEMQYTSEEDMDWTSMGSVDLIVLFKDYHQQFCEEESETQISPTEKNLFSRLLYIR